MNFNFYEEEREERMDELNEYLTPREVMDLLFIGKNTFYKLVHSGKLRSFRIGKLWRVKKAELLSFAQHSESKYIYI